MRRQDLLEIGLLELISADQGLQIGGPDVAFADALGDLLGYGPIDNVMFSFNADNLPVKFMDNSLLLSLADGLCITGGWLIGREQELEE